VTAIQMTLDRDFFIFPAPNFPGDATGRWHTNLRSTVTLVIDTDDGSRTEVQGHANFFLVRGDSAVIAYDLLRQGVGPDSTRWYLRRWDDETATLCRIKGLYQ